MLGIKSIIDNLELIGHSVDDGALVIHTLNGLSSAYMPLASAVRARDTPISFEELYDKLLDHEAYLRQEASKKFGTQITAQFNQRSFNRRGRGQHGNFSPTGQHHQFGSQNSSSYSSPSGQHSSNNRGTNSTHHNNYRTHNQPHAAHQSQHLSSSGLSNKSHAHSGSQQSFPISSPLCQRPKLPEAPRMKHVAIDFFFVRDQVARQQLRVAHVNTKDQLADSLTKALSRKHFQDHRFKIGILPGSSILRGHIRDRDSHDNN
ncbi:hypothetical protein ACOSQ2_014526 [Xanthoceras sorbifolium]